MFDWMPFWECFKAVIDDNEDLAKVQKFSYLKSQVKGSVARVLSNLSLTAANYETAKDLLRKRYGQKSVMRDSYAQRIISAVRVTDVTDVDGLR